MQLIKRTLLYIFLVLLVTSCIEPFIPDDLDYEPMLFIQAIVTDNPDIQPSVVLSNTFPLLGNEEETPAYINTSGATVYIERDDNAKYYFLQSNYTLWGRTGTSYYLPDPTFTLSQDYSYKLVIVTSDGHIFESEYESYNPSTPVNDIKYQYDKQSPSELELESEGYKFFISTSGDGEEESYFRWELDETYRYFSPFMATYMWTGSRLIDTANYHLIQCYKDENVKGIYIGSTAGLSENSINDLPLHFVSQYGDKLQVEYSLHAYQYHISQSAFQFWWDLRKLLYETGGLYETQPFRISGNIQCLSDPPINVAGIFEVAGVSEKRIFVPTPTEFRAVTERCIADTVGIETNPWDMVPAGSWILELDDGVFQTADAVCFDCTLKGGYTTKPPFWEK